MKYADIIDAALTYSDRKDADIVNSMDMFLRIVESRINRNLRIMQMSTRSVVLTSQDQHYFGLPNLFAGIRDIEIRDKDAVKGATCVYASPEQMNNKVDDAGKIYYSIVANQIQIYPPQADKVLEIIYYQRLEPLTSNKDTNWLSDRYPDAYIFALLVEMAAYVKSPDAIQIWEQRLQATISEIEKEDSTDRWSGTSMTIKVG